MPKRILTLDFSFLQRLHRPSNKGRKITNLIGRKFDRITPLGFLGLGRHGARWLCRCDCGSIWVVIAVKLLNQTTRSCGCFRNDRIASLNRSHGLAVNRQRHPVLQVQSWMITRCYNQKDKKYSNYGGRGIRVCQRWHTPIFFYQDMGDPPTPEHSIDRKDNNGNYSCGKCEECLENEWPMNVRWATRLQQARNKRNTRYLTARNLTLPVTEWAERLNNGLRASAILKRKKRGWSDEEALGFIQRT